MSANIQTVEIELAGKLRTVFAVWCNVTQCKQAYSNRSTQKAASTMNKLWAAGVRARLVKNAGYEYVEILQEAPAK